jgi:hypothetical protein
LKQQTAPQARWQTPEVILERKALEYDPRNPGGKILIGALGTDSDGNLALWFIIGSQVAQSAPLGVVPANWQLVGQRNFNGDGFFDLLGATTTRELSRSGC